jgi:lipopolysaccharide transport system permease protein
LSTFLTSPASRLNLLRMTKSSASFVSVFSSFWRNRDLIRQLTRRDVLGRYRESFLGLCWSFLNPLLMLAIYTFVFGYIFPSRWDRQAGSPLEFAIILFAGLIIVNLFSECLNRACNLIVSNSAYVKKVLFPLEILPWTTVGSALYHCAVSVVMLLMLYAAVHRRFEPTALLLPVLFLPFILLTVGVCWFLSSLGVFLRDIGNPISLMTTMLMFLSPVFYSLSAVPESVRPYFFLNPMTFIIVQSRDLLFGQGGLNWGGWSLYLFVGLGVAWSGFALFQKLKKGFADVL